MNLSGCCLIGIVSASHPGCVFFEIRTLCKTKTAVVAVLRLLCTGCICDSSVRNVFVSSESYAQTFDQCSVFVYCILQLSIENIFVSMVTRMKDKVKIKNN